MEPPTPLCLVAIGTPNYEMAAGLALIERGERWLDVTGRDVRRVIVAVQRGRFVVSL